MPHPVSLSVLDVAPVLSGASVPQALANSADLARHVEALGYERYWLAEHHNTAGIASSVPAILIAHIAAATSTLRVGSGGVMLPNHSPLHVAESFRLLEGLHPGRIDLGIGRAPGTDGLTALALRRSREALYADDFPEQLDEMLAFLGDHWPSEHPFSDLVASPRVESAPPVYLLGSSGFSGALAARLGLGFALASHINPGPAARVRAPTRTSSSPPRRSPSPGPSSPCRPSAPTTTRPPRSSRSPSTSPGCASVRAAAVRCRASRRHAPTAGPRPSSPSAPPTGRATWWVARQRCRARSWCRRPRRA
ncbi:MAG: MsnO8 family LLM class oxidoreductase [Acidimicrobiales bacterium]